MQTRLRRPRGGAILPIMSMPLPATLLLEACDVKRVPSAEVVPAILRNAWNAVGRPKGAATTLD
jgi:hypothetical protein